MSSCWETARSIHTSHFPTRGRTLNPAAVMQPTCLLASPNSSHAAATLRRLGSLHPPPAAPPAAPAATAPVLSIAGGSVYFFCERPGQGPWVQGWADCSHSAHT